MARESETVFSERMSSTSDFSDNFMLLLNKYSNYKNYKNFFVQYMLKTKPKREGNLKNKHEKIFKPVLTESEDNS